MPNASRDLWMHVRLPLEGKVNQLPIRLFGGPLSSPALAARDTAPMLPNVLPCLGGGGGAESVVLPTPCTSMSPHLELLRDGVDYGMDQWLGFGGGLQAPERADTHCMRAGLAMGPDPIPHTSWRTSACSVATCRSGWARRTPAI